MTALEVLAELHRREARVLAIGDRLRIRPGPAGLTDELREAIRACKADLLALLNTPTHSCTGCGRFAFPKPTVCYWCRHPNARGAA